MDMTTLPFVVALATFGLYFAGLFFEARATAIPYFRP